jgi:hypothetical protein
MKQLIYVMYTFIFGLPIPKQFVCWNSEVASYIILPPYNAYCFFAFVSEYRRKAVFFLQITPPTDLFPSTKSGSNLFDVEKIWYAIT